MAQSLSRRQKQTLQVGYGGLSLLAFDAERLVMAHSFRTCSGSFLLDRRRERASGECHAFRLGLDEGRPLDVEGFSGSLKSSLELSMHGLRVKESLPEEPAALVRVLGVVPAPQLVDQDREIGRRPFHQRPCHMQGFGKLLPYRDSVCDCGRAGTTGVRYRGIGNPLRGHDDVRGRLIHADFRVGIDGLLGGHG